MKLLHVVPTYLPAVRYGGPIYSVHGLCRALAHRGHAVKVFTTNVDGAGVSDVPVGVPVVMDGVEVTYFATGLGRRLYRSPDMWRVLSDQIGQFDVAHLHSVFLWPTTAGAAAARRAKIPYVLSPRGMLVPELIQRKSRIAKSLWIRAFERRNVAAAASVHVTSEIEAHDLARLAVATQRVAMIPNGVDMPPDALLQKKQDREGGRSKAMPVVLCLGRVSWKKGIDRLIRAMAQVPQGRLVIAGGDDEGHVAELRAVAAECGMTHRVEFLGEIAWARKWELLEQAEVFALASHSENFGIAVLEAMSCGVPVIVTPEVGLAKVVAETGAGLVAGGRAEEFGMALSRLLSDPQLRRDMGRVGRSVAQERFGWASIARSMEDVYMQILPKTRVR